MAVPLLQSPLVAWTTNFYARATADAAKYNLSVAQLSAYTTVHEAYLAAAAALTASDASSTRSKALREARDAARDALLPLAREYYKLILASTSISDADKTLIGVHVPKRPTSVTAPTSQAKMDIEAVVGRTVKGRIHRDDGESKRGKPTNVIGAKVYSYVGSSYPSDPALWAYQGDFTKGDFTVTFDATVPAGAQVWLACSWYTRTALTGPISMPVTTFLQFAGVAAQAKPMTIAA
ncbi:MAG TPA: hypothetical protein VGN72_04650 [Tepidisphaeraceae bacterium]|jgi:hypothetical protein|nr:hypothetical protein [Tepidisphaeraceae bacterium]